MTHPTTSPTVLTVVPRDVLLTHAGVRVYNGGYGSALATDPRVRGHFYLLTDRGPNFDVSDPCAKGFAVPMFQPCIGRFQVRGKELVRIDTIGLAGPDGRPLSGIPPSPSEGGTGERPVGLDGTDLPLDPEGIDPEGLAALADGSFWVSDEYGPALAHIDAAGHVRERVTPHASAAPGRECTAARTLPLVYARRWPNRGLEAVALLPDGCTLAAMTQSALDNPAPGAGARSPVVRILLFDTTTGASRQYVYLQDAAGLSNSALAALGQTSLITVEHDRRFTMDLGEPSRVKRVYAIDLASATDVSDARDGPGGLLIDGRPLETLDASSLHAAGICPVEKRSVVDLVALGYPHDKPEGIAVLDDRTIAVLNDDDFGIASDGRGGIQPKLLPGTGIVDHNTVWIIPIASLR